LVPEIKLGLELLPEATAAAAKLSGAELSQATGRALFEEIGFGAPKGLTFFTHETSLGSLSHEIGISPETSGAVGNLTDSSGSAKAFLEAAEDSTKTYKVLSVDGKSPAASSVDWSLPKQAEDGTWTPGEWLNLHDTPENAYLLNTRPALHVSNVPQQWRLGQSNVRVFEAEIAPDDKLIGTNYKRAIG